MTQRLRITFAKTAAMKYSGHLDLHKTWERTLRRARLPLAYSQGFSPHPKLQLGAALPLGFTSGCEVMDVWMEAAQDLEAAHAAVAEAAPPGLEIIRLEAVDEASPAVQTQTVATEYVVIVASDLSPADMDARIAELLAAPEIRRTRRKKEYDLRPLIESLERTESDELGHTLVMRLAAREGATGRPDEVVEALGEAAREATYHRRRLFLTERAIP